jgi:hypothetical protein
MSVRLSAAICGATILFACSSIAMARSGIRAVRPVAVNRINMAVQLLARHRCTILIGLAMGRAAHAQPQVSAITQLLGLLRSKLICVRGLAAFVTAADPATP